MRDQEQYPYTVEWLYDSHHIKKLSGSEIRSLALRMMQRLCESKTDFVWSHGHGETAAVLVEPDKVVYYSCRIYFAHKEDELAFRLTWGIHTHYE